MMNNLVSFLNSFMSYLLLVAVFLAVAGIGFALGRVLRKRKNASIDAQTVEDQNNAE